MIQNCKGRRGVFRARPFGNGCTMCCNNRRRIFGLLWRAPAYFASQGRASRIF